MAERPDSALLYGDTGCGKTVQLGELAKWEWNRSGRVSRLISADSGWDPIEDLVTTPDKPFGTSTPSGPCCIEAWNIQYLLNPFPVLIKLSEGAWPRVDATQKKIVMQAARLHDGALLSGDGKHKVGMVAIEGLSTISAMLMQDHIRNLRKIAEDIVGDFTGTVDVQVQDAQGKVTQSQETMKFGKSGRAHYGHIQDFVLLDLVPRFATLPVARVVWTAHEAKGTDDITGVKDSVLGPATIGKAAVARTAMKFGDTFHLVASTASVTGADRQSRLVTTYRAYYGPHPDEQLTRMYWPAKLSLPLDRVDALNAQFPGGYVPLTIHDGGLEKFLSFKLDSQGPAAKVADVSPP